MNVAGAFWYLVIAGELVVPTVLAPWIPGAAVTLITDIVAVSRAVTNHPLINAVPTVALEGPGWTPVCS